MLHILPMQAIAINSSLWHRLVFLEFLRDPFPKPKPSFLLLQKQQKFPVYSIQLLDALNVKSPVLDFPALPICLEPTGSGRIIFDDGTDIMNDPWNNN